MLMHFWSLVSKRPACKFGFLGDHLGRLPLCVSQFVSTITHLFLPRYEARLGEGKVAWLGTQHNHPTSARITNLLQLANRHTTSTTKRLWRLLFSPVVFY